MRGTVWGYNIERARSKFLDIVEQYKMIGIQPTKVVNSKYNVWAEFENGDRWNAVNASERQRGQKSSIAYIDTEIDKEIIDCIILPTTFAPPYNAIRYYWVEKDDEIETKLI